MCVCIFPITVSPVGYVGFTQPSYSVQEGDGVMDVCVELQGDEDSYVLGKPLSVRLSSEGETAEGENIVVPLINIIDY